MSSSIRENPIVVDAALRALGERIATARVRRGLRLQDIATRSELSINTVRAVEAGVAGTGIGALACVLWVLGLLPHLDLVAEPGIDREGLVLDLARHGRRASPPISVSNDF